MNVINNGVDYVKNYVLDLKKDITTLTSAGEQKKEANQSEMIKSVALRIIGGMVFVSSVAAAFLAVVSLMNIALVVTVGWTTICIAAVIFGHDLVKIGENIKKQLAASGEGQQASTAVPKHNVLEGTWLCQPIYEQLQSLKGQFKPT